jgi:putative acetyltransferase
MFKLNMIIRNATKKDGSEIREVYQRAFPKDEGDIVANLAVNLLSEVTTPQTISLVADTEGNVVGHVALSPLTIGSNKNLQGYILAPLGVKPDYQHHRIGTQLIENGIQQLSRLDVDILFVYGDPKYYSRFGFSTNHSHIFVPPYKLQYSFGWQLKQLKDCVLPRTPISLLCVRSLMKPELW